MSEINHEGAPARQNSSAKLPAECGYVLDNEQGLDQDQCFDTTRVLTRAEVGDPYVVRPIRILGNRVLNEGDVKPTALSDFFVEGLQNAKRSIVDHQNRRVHLKTTLLSPPDRLLTLDTKNDAELKAWLDCRRDFHRRTFFQKELPHVIQGVGDEYKELFIVYGTILAAMFPEEEEQWPRHPAANDNMRGLRAANDNDA